MIDQFLIDGTSGKIETEFLDDNYYPIVPRAGYPTVTLYDEQGIPVLEASGDPSANPGFWEATINLPMMGIEDAVVFTARWFMVDQNGDKWKSTQKVKIKPKVQDRIPSVVLFDGDEDYEIVLPARYVEGSELKITFYKNNEKVVTQTQVDVETVTTGTTKTKLVLPIPQELEPRLESYLIAVRLNRRQVYTYSCYLITPRIAMAMQAVEQFLNKAQLRNVIPQLSWKASDLMYYLEQGLHMFNMIYQPTAFTGLNMQGTLYSAWLICSWYYALGAQLIAEGSLQFDFSGQGVSLNVDRTPQLDGALGRIEGKINDMVVPLKKQLAIQGIKAGDGSIGDTPMRNPLNMARLNIINAPTTRIAFSNYGRQGFAPPYRRGM